jgi:predicted regulator of Ras-like GTPase activity (Roadblock/LC7/MglB family)
MISPFADIMRQAVESTPGAIGGAFADADGETVDLFASDREDWAILTAHYGIVLNFVKSAFNVFHYGDAQFMLLRHTEVDVMMQSVADGYYAIMAMHSPAPLGTAMSVLDRAVVQLRQEMG